VETILTILRRIKWPNFALFKQ